MKRQFFSGNTLEQAVMLAARHFGLDPERVAYNVREKKHGFIKVRRRVVIEVDEAEPERSPDDVNETPSSETPSSETRPSEVRPSEVRPSEARPSEARPSESVGRAGSRARTGSRRPEPPARATERRREASPPRPERGSLSESASVERAIREILRFLDVEAELEIGRRDDVFEVEILNPDQDVLIDSEGQVLLAMEYLVPRVVRSWMGQGVPVKVDCDGFRAGREQELRELAWEVADEVRQDGVSQSLEPMSPADRRQIHLALAGDPDVYTESEGDGYFKRVRVSPEDGPHEVV